MGNRDRIPMTVTKAAHLFMFLAIIKCTTCAENDVSLALSVDDVAEGRSALFIRNAEHNLDKNVHRTTRQGLTNLRVSSTVDSPSSSPSMEQTVNNILQWLQGKYTQNNRIARQQFPSRQYLPAVVSTTQKPRPFQTTLSSNPRFETEPNQDQPQYQAPRQNPTVEIENAGYPYQEQPKPEFNIPSRQQPISTSSPTYLNPTPTQPSTPIAYDVPRSSYEPSPYPKVSYPTPGFPTIDTSTSTFAEQSPKTVAETPSAPVGFSQTPDYIRPDDNSSPTSSTFDTTNIGNEIDSDAAHPPHIHAIDVKCSKERMTIDIEFNRRFDGVIYSKGYYNSPECRYVSPNSGQTKYSFTVMLNSCGTQFVDEFSEGKQAYLENVLVLQNEVGIQEVWDSVRSVRCLWEGNLNKALSVALSVGMLNQEVVTFSGDTATARLDIQMGRGPFAPLANGLVKIGETMTLVVTVEGDPAFNVLVRECTARDNDPESGNVVKLTDDDGCILKPKLIGAFQTSRNPDTNSVIAYAFFNAFKFPDIMDLTIECNVELCKTECRPCSIADQKTEPGKRRRRRRNVAEAITIDESTTLKDNNQQTNNTQAQNKENNQLKLKSIRSSMVVPGYSTPFNPHAAEQKQLNFEHPKTITYQHNSTSEKNVKYQLHDKNINDDLLSEIFINVDPIVVNRRLMVYAPGDILTSDHVRQVATYELNPSNNESRVVVAVGSSNGNIKICLTPATFFSVAAALMATLVMSCVSCIMLWSRTRAKTVF